MWEEMIVNLIYHQGELAGSYGAPYRYPFSAMDRKEAIRVLANSSKQEGVCITLHTRFYSTSYGSCPPWYGKSPLMGEVEYTNLAGVDRT